MATFAAHKVVSGLPDPLEPDAVYYVRTGAGFDVYVTDTTGLIAYAQNTEDDLTWSDYATRWDDAPTLNAAITGGTVYNYTLDGVTRYRFVPTAYAAASDAFYATFDGTTLSEFIASRGLITTLPVTTAMLKGAGSNFFAAHATLYSGDGSFAIAGPDGKTYTFGNSDLNVFTGQVTDMSQLFVGTSFNGDIGYWDTSSVTNMSAMFFIAGAFNQDISGWDVASVTDFSEMFTSASSFNQPLDSWDVSGVTSMNNMFSFSGLSTENYSRTLIGWANRAYNGGANNGVQSNVNLGASGVQYNTLTYVDAWPNQPGQQFTDGASARAYLVSTMGWTISDSGQA